MLIYLPDANNLNNFIAKLMAEENRGLTPQDLKPFLIVSGVCLTVEVQNLNPQQEKALAEFLSGSDVFANLPFVGYFALIPH